MGWLLWRGVLRGCGKVVVEEGFLQVIDGCSGYLR